MLGITALLLATAPPLALNENLGVLSHLTLRSVLLLGVAKNVTGLFDACWNKFKLVQRTQQMLDERWPNVRSV